MLELKIFIYFIKNSFKLNNFYHLFHIVCKKTEIDDQFQSTKATTNPKLPPVFVFCDTMYILYIHIHKTGDEQPLLHIQYYIAQYRKVIGILEY